MEIRGDVGGISDTVFLMVVASVGVTLNALVAASLLTTPTTAAGHRREAASFVIHACLLDGVKSAYCVPFAITSLESVDASVCDALSRSLCGLSVPNLLTMVRTVQMAPVVYCRSIAKFGKGSEPECQRIQAVQEPATNAPAPFDLLTLKMVVRVTWLPMCQF